MAELMTKNTAIISSRARAAVRIGPQVAKCVTEVLDANISGATDKAIKLALPQVDIAISKLPVLDEAVVPATVPMFAQFELEHSKAWSAEISKYDGCVIVTPSYDLGVPGGVKHAIEYLYNEIKGKRFLVISHGNTGGGPAGDALPMDLMKGIYAHVVETRPTLSFAENESFGYGMPVDMRLAATGKIGEGSLTHWANKKSDIVKGFEEFNLLKDTKPSPAQWANRIRFSVRIAKKGRVY